MTNKVDVTICLGSSCFARGNKKTVSAIETYIRDNELHDHIFLHGGHCFGNCQNGPSIKINGKIYENVDPLNIIDILAKIIKE